MFEFSDRTAPVADELFVRLVSDSLTTHVADTVGVAEI